MPEELQQRIAELEAVTKVHEERISATGKQISDSIEERMQVKTIAFTLVPLAVAALGWLGVIDYNLQGWVETRVRTETDFKVTRAVGRAVLAKEEDYQRLFDQLSQSASEAGSAARVASLEAGKSQGAAEAALDRAVATSNQLEMLFKNLSSAIGTDEKRAKDLAQAIRDLGTQLKTQADEVKTAQQGIKSLLPIGTVIAWPGTAPSAWPEGWELCGKDKTAEYSDKLWSVLGGLYGNTDPGEDGKRPRIKLPNFQGMFLRGAGIACDVHGTSKGDHRSNELGQPQWDLIRNHEHDGVVSGLVDGGVRHATANTASGRHPSTAMGNSSGQMRTAGTIGGGPETRPANYAVHWIIRVK